VPTLPAFTEKDNSHTIILGIYVIIFGLGMFPMSTMTRYFC
jgi:hypothetical protein